MLDYDPPLLTEINIRRVESLNQEQKIVCPFVDRCTFTLLHKITKGTVIFAIPSAPSIIVGTFKRTHDHDNSLLTPILRNLI